MAPRHHHLPTSQTEMGEAQVNDPIKDRLAELVGAKTRFWCKLGLHMPYVQVREVYDLAHEYIGLMVITTCLNHGCDYEKWSKTTPERFNRAIKAKRTLEELEGNCEK